MSICHRTLSEIRPWSRVVALMIVTSAAYADEPFDYFQNSWNVIGLKDYLDGTRVTPDNRLLLADGEVRLRFGRQLTPLSRKQTKQVLKRWLPVILLQSNDSHVRYEFTFWATPLPTVADWQKAFDWPTEGENFLNWIKIEVTNAGTQEQEAKVKVEQTGRPGSIGRSFRWTLPPDGSAGTVVRIPFKRVADPTVFDNADPQTWLDRTIEYWRGLMDGAARIEVPCRKATEALLAAHVCQLIANDHGELQGGEGFYDEFYIRDGGYQIMELEEAGLWDAVDKAILHYQRRQRPDGRFETQRNQLDANGQAVWVLWQCYQIKGDRDWLAKVYPQMRRAVDWAMKTRREAPEDSPFAGLLPVAPADGEYLWDGKHHIVGYDLWNLRAILCTAAAAEVLGKQDERDELRAEAELYSKAIDAASKRARCPHFPPSWEKDGTHWGNTETLWPTPVVDRTDSRVAATIKHAREIHGDGFIEGTIQWLGRAGAIHPYMSAYTTMASLRLGEHEQVVQDFYWYLLHSTAAHAFPEGIYWHRRFAWSNTIPHVTGASNYALMLRHMLIDEDEGLHLLRAVPDWWLEDGREIRVRKAPTHFGPMSLVVRGTKQGVEVELEPPKRDPPPRIVLYLPKSRPLVGSIAGVDVVTRTDQQQRWDFPTVIKLYRQQAGALFRPLPNLVALPIESAIAKESCRPLDLTAAANTDPFTAPFGVPKPGKFLFTGMPVGHTTIGGVPFSIIDPAKNEGRGLVVLHSPRAPTNIKWPREVEVPVRAQGKRLFFLGNVHGWSSQDPGTGEWGAVAEYVIHYADGETDTVPLITGRTADEWALPPEATDVYAGLSGRPWHLNVLGVKVRPATIEKVVFRDLGTPAAPVLAAVTLEQ